MFHCPLHPELYIQVLDPNLTAQKHFYCCKCLTAERETSTEDFKTIEEFLDYADQVLSQTKLDLNITSQPLPKHANILLRQGENFEKLSRHIEQEKSALENKFQDIINKVTQVINQNKEDCLKLLDAQIESLNGHYDLFKKLFEEVYPKQEEVRSLFPPKEDLIRKVNEAENFDQLSNFVEKIKEKLNLFQSQKEEMIQKNESNTNRLCSVAKFLESLEYEKPHFEIVNFDFNTLEFTGAVKRDLDEYIQKVMVARNMVPEVIPLLTYPKSEIIKFQDFETIREWLPQKYDFTPTLLYRSSRDGPTFHNKCDGKGPTISLIKCCFEGTTLESVIGGFLDKDWHNRDHFITSEEAFVFSLTSKTKCSVSEPEKAALGGGGWAVNFGSGTINIPDKLGQGYCCLGSTYINQNKLVDFQDYKGGKIPIQVQEIEVFSFKEK